MERDIDSARQGPAFPMHVILGHILDQKFVAIEAIEDRLDATEEEMLADPASFSPAEMLRLRRDLLALRKCRRKATKLGRMCRVPREYGSCLRSIQVGL